MCENSDLNYPPFSVLMSLYYKEKPEYLRECLNSLLNQTVKADEWVIVKDGPLTNELEAVLKEYDEKFPNLIKYVIFEKNQGLGLALRAGVPACSHELIARMDTDDICVPNRFERQLQEFINNSKLDVCGSHQIEFNSETKEKVAQRKVPLNQKEIYKYQKKRSAFNHVTVMFRKQAVLNSGNYEDCPLMEDDMLWSRMFLNNSCVMNIDDYLVHVRVGSEMFKRRGGLTYFYKYKMARKKIYNIHYISLFDYIYTIFIQFFVCVMPNKLREFIFIKLLRRNVK